MARIEFGEDLASNRANSVYLLKTENDVITGILSLQEGVDTNKHIVNLQEYMATLADVLGVVGETDPNAKVYLSTEFIANGDDRKVALEKLDGQVKVNADAILSNATGVADINALLGQANGIAQLDGDGRLPLAQLPNNIFQYVSNWDASTNTPTLVDGTGSTGQVYRVNVAGTQDLGSGSQDYAIGDKVVYNNAGVWEKWDTNDEVTSVFGRTGPVVAQAGDYTPAQVGLGSVLNEAQLTRADGDFNTFIEKLSPDDDDIVLIEDSANSFAKRKMKVSELGGGGGGSGTGFRNFLGNNSDADNGLGDWVNSAGTITLNSTTPLSGTNDFQFDITTPTNGVIAYCPFAVDRVTEQTSEKLYISFDFDTTGIAVERNDIRVNILDEDNTVQLPIFGDEVIPVNTIGKKTVSFQAVPGTTNYRLEISRTGGAGTPPTISFNADNLTVGPREIINSEFRTEWTVSFDGASNFYVNDENVGQSVLKLGAGVFRVYYNKTNFPSDPIVHIQTEILDLAGPVTGTIRERGSDGTGDYVTAWLFVGGTAVDLSGTDRCYMTFSQVREDQTLNNDTIDPFIERHTSTSGQVINTTVTTVVYENLDISTDLIYNNATGIGTCTRTGYYAVKSSLQSAASTNADDFALFLYKNGAEIAELDRKTSKELDTSSAVVTLRGSDTILLQKDDTFSIRAISGTSTRSLTTTANKNILSVVLVR